MPPRYVYWTIIVDGQPTAFRSGSLEDIMPTFNRLKEKQPSAELKWFQNGQLWTSRHDAQDFMRARGARGRAKDPRQSGDRGSGIGDRGSNTPERVWNAKPEWKTRSTFKPRSEKSAFAPSGDKPKWTPKGTVPEGRPFTGRRESKPAWSPKGDAGDKPEWKPKGSFKPHEAGHRASARDQARSSFKPKSYTPKVDDGRTRSSRLQSRQDKLEWKPAPAKATARQAPDSRPAGPNAGFAKRDPDAPKRKWVPKAEYKKSLGIEARRDAKWRPGGEHKDPKQKYKDAKKAKWTRVKQTIRARSTRPRKPKGE